MTIKELVTDYPRLPFVAAREMYGHWCAHSLTHQMVKDQTNGWFKNLSDLISVQKALEEVYQLTQNINKPGQKAFNTFEAEASKVFHRTAKISHERARDPEFWRWVTFGGEEMHGLKIIDFRYKSKKKDSAPPARFALGDMNRAFFPYLWFRSDSLFDHDEVDNKLYDFQTKITDIDFWISHVIRVDYGSCPPVTRAFVKFVVNNNLPRGEKPTERGYRDLSKEMTRRNASNCLELLDDKQADEFVVGLWNSKEEWSTKLVPVDDAS